MSYYDPNYWRRYGPFYPYQEQYPVVYPAPSVPAYRPADPLEMLGLGKRVVYAGCVYCGALIPDTLQFCPNCGAQRL